LEHIYAGVFLDMKFAEVISQLVKDKLITNVKEHNPEHCVTGSLTKYGEEFVKNAIILQNLELKFEMRKNEVKNADEARQKAETYYQVTFWVLLLIHPTSTDICSVFTFLYVSYPLPFSKSGL